MCVANAARSQMAEALARALLPAQVRVASAGSVPGPCVHPLAVQVMAELAIDMSGQFPKAIRDVALDEFEVVAALCAEEQCPVLPTQLRRLDWSLPDPAQGADPDAQLQAFRSARDAIRARVVALQSHLLGSA